MNTDDNAIYALLVGLQKASQDLNTSQESLKHSILNLPSKNSIFLAQTKQLILEKSLKETPKAASSQLKVPESLIIEILKKYLSEQTSSINSSLYPYDTNEKFCQTVEIPSKNWSHVASETDFPYKIQKKSFTTLERLAEIKKSLLQSSSLPSNTIEKWKKKLQHSLFQEPHLLSYSLQKKSQNFKDIDTFLVKWYRAKPRTFEAIREKCKKISAVANLEFEVSDDWIQNFKKYYQLD